MATARLLEIQVEDELVEAVKALSLEELTVHEKNMKEEKNRITEQMKVLATHKKELERANKEVNDKLKVKERSEAAKAKTKAKTERMYSYIFKWKGEEIPFQLAGRSTITQFRMQFMIATGMKESKVKKLLFSHNEVVMRGRSENTGKDGYDMKDGDVVEVEDLDDSVSETEQDDEDAMVEDPDI
ncbi:unnamed protein product [Effrenium voratum]|uniref:Uncharacterized protein n=1 Tax=Effrenium voratum TaxID=2562239 RepID=A0AA36MJF5_9DINO|nr:unnamed protein product [Effrenium voratum]CAJ1379053.1 unnamed protein product [Effrenium voratum]CAJ1441910.1 unnamed protein product [Effrenium voratum]